MRIGGHVVRAVYRGESGLEEFGTFDPEVILCDIRMPGMSGFEFARRLRSANRGASPLLVALTGFGTDADRAASAEAGFDRHLVKPVDPDELTTLLHEAARRSEAGSKQR